MGRLVIIGLVVVCLSPALAHTTRGLVESVNAENVALLVGVAHGLPGIDIDVKTVETMASHPAYNYKSFHIDNEAATTTTIPIELAKKAEMAGPAGSFFFYFSGHGSPTHIYLQDTLLSVEDMRAAIEKGRKNIGPLSRLIIMFDSCYSGSLLGPFSGPMSAWAPLEQFTQAQAAAKLVSNIARAFESSGRNYWTKLFVFASSRADETSLAGDTGSVFTNALKKAYDEVIESNGMMSEWVEKTKTYTEGHHPVERFSPAALSAEKMKP